LLPREKPDAPFGLVDPVLKQAGGTENVTWFSNEEGKKASNDARTGTAGQ
jgi:hypothetical protein